MFEVCQTAGKDYTFNQYTYKLVLNVEKVFEMLKSYTNLELLLLP